MLLNDSANRASSGSRSSSSRTSRPPEAMSVATDATLRNGRNTLLLLENPNRPPTIVINKIPRIKVVRIVFSVRSTSVKGNASK